MITCRLDSGMPSSFLRLAKKDDGSIELTLGSFDPCGTPVTNAIAGFRASGNARTYSALVNLAAAMAADNLDTAQSGWRPEGLTDADQHFFVSWAQRLESARREIDAANQRERSCGYGWGESREDSNVTSV